MTIREAYFAELNIITRLIEEPELIKIGLILDKIREELKNKDIINEIIRENIL